MFITEVRRVFIAVAVAWSGAVPPSRLCRFLRCRVCFPDIGVPFGLDFGFLRYPGERVIDGGAPVEEFALLRRMLEIDGAAPGETVATPDHNQKREF